jgi:hypothetical protein
MERIERASGFALSRVHVEELPAGSGPIAELRRAAERVAQETRSLTGRNAAAPSRSTVLRPAALRDRLDPGSGRPIERRSNPLRPSKRSAPADSTQKPR